MDSIKIYTRKNLNKLFDNIKKYKILYVSAGMGYGKTTAVKNYLIYNSIKYIWFVVDDIGDEDSLSQHFYETVTRGVGISCGVKDFEETFINTLEHIVTEKTVIVIDNWSGNKFSKLNALVKAICQVKNKNVKIIIIGQSKPELFFSLNKDCFGIEHKHFEFSCEDIMGLFEINRLPIDSDRAKKLLSSSNGQISVIYLILADYCVSGKLEVGLSVNKGIGRLLYERLKKEIKISMIKVSLLEHFTEEQAIYISDTRDIINILENMYNSNFFISFDAETKTYRFHNILKKFFQNEMLQEDIDIKEVYKKNAAYFYEKGLYVQAIENYYSVGEYEKICELIDYINPADLFNTIPNVANRILIRMKPEEQLNHQIVYLSCIYSYILCVDANHGIEKLNNFEKLINEHNDMNNKFIKAEILLIKAFVNYGNFNLFSLYIEQAYDIFGKNTSRIIKSGTVFNFGVPCVLYLYHKQIGKMKQLCKKFKNVISMFSSITNGCGSGIDYMISAEACFETGNYDEVETLAKNAFYKANYNTSTKSVIIEIYFLLLRYYIMNGDFENAKKNLQIIESIRQEEDSFSPSIKSQIDMSIGYIWGCLGRLDKIPKWICAFNVNHSKAVFQGKEACFIMFGIAMILEGEYERLLVHSEIMLEKYINNGNIYRLIYAFIFAGIAKYKLGKKQEAQDDILKAVECAQPDNIEVPFIELSTYCINILDDIRDRSQYINGIYDKCKRYVQIIENINKKKSSNKFNLSNRETEVLKMIASGKRQLEVASELYISLATVKSHVKNIYNKLGANNRREAIDIWNKYLKK